MSLVTTGPSGTGQWPFHTPHAHVKELDTWMKKFIRGSSYIVSDTKRYASKADGNLVPLRSLDHLTTTLTAK